LRLIRTLVHSFGLSARVWPDLPRRSRLWSATTLAAALKKMDDRQEACDLAEIMGVGLANTQAEEI